MWLSRTVDWLNRIVQPISRVIHGIGVSVLTAMMLLTFADVFLRYVFSRPILGAFDTTEYMMVIVVSFGLAYCAMEKGHVRVDFITSRLRQRSQDIINAITGFLGFALVVLIVWQTFIQIKDTFISGVASQALLIPVYPFAALCAVGLTVFCLVLLIDFLDFLSQAVKK